MQSVIYGSHFRLIEVPILVDQAAQTVITIPDQPDIRYARILNIETYSASDLTNSFPSGYTVIADADLKKCALTLETNDADVDPEVNGMGKNNPTTGQYTDTPGRFNSTQQNFQYMPLSSLHYLQNASTNSFQRAVRYFPDMYVTWQKSYINIAPGGLGNSDIVAVVLGVTYTWLTITKKQIPRT